MQFEGMSDTPFTYSDYEEARHNLIQQVNDSLTETDREFSSVNLKTANPIWGKMLCRRFKPLSVRKMEITEHCQAEKEQSSKAQGGIGKATDLLISEEGISFYGIMPDRLVLTEKQYLESCTICEK